MMSRLLDYYVKQLYKYKKIEFINTYLKVLMVTVLEII